MSLSPKRRSYSPAPRGGGKSASRSPRRERSRERRRSYSRSRSPRRSRSPARRDSSRGGGGGGDKKRGIACRWNDRGFGFISPNDGGEDVFCHLSAITDGNALEDGKEVQYENVYDDRKGKYHAVNVTGGVQEQSKRPSGGGRGGGSDVEMCGDFKLGRCFRDHCRYSHGDGGGDRGGGGGYGGGGDRYDDRRGGGGGDRYGGGGGGSRYDDRGRSPPRYERRGSPRY